jgi:transcriptional regulator with GAF, ATPase, and Fis domain
VVLVSGDLLSGRYRIGAPLGAGGAATVFLAQAEPSGAECVVKQLRIDSPEILEAFRSEFALLARLSHPSLLRVLDFGTARVRNETLHYYVAERLAGSSLAERAKKPATTTALLAPLLDALEGLAALHDNQIRHGDFTPFNVMVDEHGRGTLIDLGCAQPLGSASSISGTPGFMAPELLERGFGDVRADLYAVGKTLERIFELAKRPPPERVARMLERLVRPNPSERPGEVREVLEAFQRRTKPRAGYWGPTRLLGRERQLKEAADWLAQLVSDRAAPRVLTVTGEPGSGVSRLCRELVWRAQLELPVLRVHWHERDSLPRALALAGGSSEPVRALRDLVAVVARLREAPRAQLLVVEEAHRLDAAQQALLLSLLRLLGDQGRLALLVSGLDLPSELGAKPLRAEPLSLLDVRSWAEGWVPERKLPELLARTRGMPRAIEAALRAVTGAPGANDRATEPEPEREAASPLSRAARRALALLAASQGALAELDEALERGAVDELVRIGFLERDGSALCLSPRAKLALERGALTARELEQAHAQLVERWQNQPASADAVGQLLYHLCSSGKVQQAEGLFRQHEATLVERASGVWRAVEPLLARSASADVLLGGAAVLLAAGQARRALGAAVRAARLEPACRVRAAARVAECLGRLGRPARAKRLLSHLLERTPEPEALLLDRLARTLLACGEYGAASDMAQRALRAADAAVEGFCHETYGVALGYLGQSEAARAELQLAREGVARAGNARDHFRVAAQAATLAFRGGRIADALTDYAAALEIAEQNELDDLLAMGLLNLGTAEQQAGLWGSALRRYDRGAALALATGRVDTELTLHYNLCNLYAEIGAFERADDSANRLGGRIEALGLAHLGLGIELVRVETALLRGDVAGARERLARLSTLESESGRGRERLEIALRRVDLLLVEGNWDDAERALEGAVASHDGDVGELRLALELAQARVLVARADTEAMARLQSVLTRAQRGGLTALEATALTELFETAQTFGFFDDARAYRERARRLWERVSADLPAHLGEAFWRHPRRRRLNEISHSAPMSGGDRERVAEVKAYRRLLSLTRRLSSSRSVAQILDYAVQAAVDLTDAERGFLLLKADVADVTSAKVVASSEPFAPERGPSRSIVRRSLEHEEAVIATDALEDPRFATQRSIHSLQLKSVLCVPVLAAAGTLGALYVDSSLQRSHFSPGDRELLVALADQVAVALANARLRDELEERTRVLEQKNLELESLARGHAQEAERLRLGIVAPPAPALRHDYAQIVGKSPAMQRLLERLDRVVDTDVNLLIHGESGTGKELVARAVHHNGPRKAGPFVGINCAALPEALLESELFGHVRGAFTGAERDKQGLLQAARGGTLFLDEIGELPPGVQSKLLRVLQEREVRPLGALASEPLDIRLLAATHRDLTSEVARGAFREDLFYRLAVVTIELPPLRERLQDLPALAASILESLAREANRKAPSLTPDALRKLSAHDFRGNVRELQNILTRAFVLGAGARLRAEDIELGARARTTLAPSAARSSSRQEFQAQERANILEALERSRWNVSAVSSALGIPRASLHRKLKRYGLQRQAR